VGAIQPTRHSHAHAGTHTSMHSVQENKKLHARIAELESIFASNFAQDESEFERRAHTQHALYAELLGRARHRQRNTLHTLRVHHRTHLKQLTEEIDSSSKVSVPTL